MKKISLNSRVIAALAIGLFIIGLEWYLYYFSGIYNKNPRNFVISMIFTVTIIGALAWELAAKK